MNNHGNISLSNNLAKRSNLSNTISRVPVSATANSRIQLSTGDFDIHETVISTEVTASNPSVAAARATAKAASIATSNLTSGTKYLSQNDLQNNFTFQISTFCTIQQISPELSDSNRYSEPYLHMNPIGNINEPKLYKNTAGFQRGTKFERLRRELESLGQDKSYNQNDLSNDFHVDSLNKSSRLSNFSTLSNRSTSSSLKSEPATYHSILSEPLTYSSDNNNPASYENLKNKYNIQKNAFLSSEFDSSDSNSNSKKIKISDLKRSDKISNFDGKLKEIKSSSDYNRDINSLHFLQTKPGNSMEKSFTLNRDIGTLFSNSSSLLETDIDSGTLSNGNLFPQTNFYGEATPYSFEKTRSMIDIHKTSDISYSEGLTRALSSEDLKKPKIFEDNNLVKRLKSKAQSTQELRIADSLTKLNVPEWMKDFRSNESRSTNAPAPDRRKLISLGDNTAIRFKDMKRHDSILSKYKYDSLPMTKVKEKPTIATQVTLPSSLYRSRSQNLVYFNPTESSKLKEAMGNVTSSLRSLNITTSNETKKVESIPVFKTSLSPSKVVEAKPPEKLFESHTQRFESKISSPKGVENDRKVEFSIKSQEFKTAENHSQLSDSRTMENKPEKPIKTFETKSVESKVLSPSHHLKHNSNEQKPEDTSVKRVILSQQDHKDEEYFNNFEEKDNIVMQSKKESQFFLQRIIELTLNPFVPTEDICDAFRINPTTLKLLLNVKRKTPNLNRDETFANMKLNESSYIENTLRRNDNNKYVICCDFKTCKNELFHTSKVSRTTCSCYNCYTYYCSKKCRNMGFTQHFHSCSFKRIREMLLKIKGNINDQQINALSKYANEAYKSVGRGVMVIAFESCRSADDFLNKQPNRLMSQPYYLRLADMTDINSKDFMDYSPEKEFIVCLLIIATLPMTSVELSYPTFKYLYRITYPFQHSARKDILAPPTKVQKEVSIENSHPKVQFDEEVKISNEKTSYETRREFFDYVIKFFETKNVSLIQNYSSIYKKLENFMSEGIHFEPLTIYIKDPLINSTVSCTIFPNKDITLKPVRTATKSSKSVEFELKQNGHKTLAETEI